MSPLLLHCAHLGLFEISPASHCWLHCTRSFCQKCGKTLAEAPLGGFLFTVARPVVDWAQERGVKQFLFVSSAGIYKGSSEPPHIEGVGPFPP